MAEKVKCKECVKVKEWSFKQNVCAFCGILNKTVKAEDTCSKGEKRK